MENERLNNLSDIFLRIVNRYNEIEKTPYSYGTDTLLHLSEVHTIETIGNNPNINITNLANLQGVTKGAISKRVQQLRKRGLVDKSISPATENEVIINLTDKGYLVYLAHQKYSEQLNKSIAKLYENLPNEIVDDLAQIGNDTEKLFINISNERKKALD